MKKVVLTTIIYLIGISLTFYWYDYKLFLIMMFMMWANNIERRK